MTELYLGRLTGKIRDTSDATAPDIDPSCEVEVTIMGGDLTATTVPAKVVSANGTPMPWYAAAMYFFGTLDVQTGTDSHSGFRAYTVAANRLGEPSAVTVRITRDSTYGTPISPPVVCLEIPVGTTFDAVVLGLLDPTVGAPTPATTFTDPMGPGVVFPGDYARIMFIAADGTTYGDTEDGTGRVPMGWYPDLVPNTSSPTTPSDGALMVTFNEVHSGGLQCWTPVVVSNYSVDNAGDHAASWQIAPKGPPESTIIKVTGASIEDNTVFPCVCLVVYKPGTLPVWAIARSLGDKQNVTSPNDVMGVLIWSDLQPGGSAAIAVAGKFWINPETNPFAQYLTDYVNYYLYYDTWNNEATPGRFHTVVPSTAIMSRPIFQHFTEGWCAVTPAVSSMSTRSVTVNPGLDENVFPISTVVMWNPGSGEWVLADLRAITPGSTVGVVSCNSGGYTTIILSGGSSAYDSTNSTQFLSLSPGGITDVPPVGVDYVVRVFTGTVVDVRITPQQGRLTSTITGSIPGAQTGSIVMWSPPGQSSSSWSLAVASQVTATTPLGVVIETASPTETTVLMYGYVDLLTYSGFPTIYWLDPTQAGAMTSTQPLTLAIQLMTLTAQGKYFAPRFPELPAIPDGTVFCKLPANGSAHLAPEGSAQPQLGTPLTGGGSLQIHTDPYNAGTNYRHVDIVAGAKIQATRGGVVFDYTHVATITNSTAAPTDPGVKGQFYMVY